MSRDWTPRESLAFEQLNISKGFGDMWSFMESLVINYNGKSERAYTDEDIELRKQFPTLGKLLNNFSELHEALSNFEGGLELLQEKDRELGAYIKAEIVKNQKDVNEVAQEMAGDLAGYIDTGVGDKDSYLVKWFEDELDPNFYYREYNDQLLVASMCEEAMQRGLSNWVLTDPDCLQVRRQTGFEGCGIFELMQVDKYPGDIYFLAVGEYDLEDYTTEEIDSALDAFGYDDMEALIEAAGSRNEAYGQLAEMLFELDSHELHVLQFESWDDALAEVERRTGKDLGAFKEVEGMSLAARLVDFYKDYDLYDYRDSLAPGATDEDAIHYMEEQLKEPASVDGILEALEEFAADPDLDEDQKEAIDGLLEDVKKLKRANESEMERKRPLDEQIQEASARVFLRKDNLENNKEKSKGDEPELQ